MYRSFFGLNEKPFAITPDPRYLYLSERHAEALAHLVYGINEAGGFIQLTGEVGTGKTTVIRSLLAQIPRNAEVALILNPRMSAPEFLLTICEELGIGVPDTTISSIKDLVGNGIASITSYNFRTSLPVKSGTRHSTSVTRRSLSHCSRSLKFIFLLSLISFPLLPLCVG